jgi:hypothetical protein
VYKEATNLNPVGIRPLREFLLVIADKEGMHFSSGLPWLPQPNAVARLNHMTIRRPLPR